MSPTTPVGSSCCRPRARPPRLHERSARALRRAHRQRQELSTDEFYFYWLTTFHEGMHAEALAYTRQTLGYSVPVIQGEPVAAVDGGVSLLGDVEIPGGKYLIGATKAFPFVFDNEKSAHEVILKPLRIARSPVTNGEFLEFVEAGGYREPRFWSDEGWHWLESGGSPQLEKSFAKFFNKTHNEPIEFERIQRTPRLSRLLEARSERALASTHLCGRVPSTE